MKKRWILVLSVLFLGALGCDDDGEVPERTEEPAAVEPDEADEAGEPEEADESAEADRETGDFDYVGVDLGDLSLEQRGNLQGLASSELCPCPDSVVSLHDCLQEEDVCEEAVEAGGRMVAVVQEGADQEAAFEQMARERVDTGRAHEFTLEGVPYKGNPDADVVIVEFADFQCPHCRTAAAMMDEVYERFGDDIVVYFKNFPLGHPTSDEAARAALAAHQQDRFWQMHGLIFEHQNQLDSRRIQSFAHQLGINFERFQQDMQSGSIQAHILRDREEALAAGVTGTPAVFVNGERYTGALMTAALSAFIQSRLDGS